MTTSKDYLKKRDYSCVIISYSTRDDIATGIYSIFAKVACSGCNRDTAITKVSKRDLAAGISYHRRQKRLYDLNSLYTLFRYILSSSISDIDIGAGESDTFRRMMFASEQILQCSVMV